MLDDIALSEEIRPWYRVDALGRGAWRILGALSGSDALWATPWQDGKWLVMDQDGRDYEIVTGGEAQSLFKTVDRADDDLVEDLGFAMVGLGAIVDHRSIANDRHTANLEARRRLNRQDAQYTPVELPPGMELPL